MLSAGIRSTKDNERVGMVGEELAEQEEGAGGACEAVRALSPRPRQGGRGPRGDGEALDGQRPQVSRELTEGLGIGGARRIRRQ